MMNGRGFTILEVLVAMVILSIGLFGVAGLMVNTVNINKTSNDMVLATTLAQEKMEKIREMAYYGVGTPGTVHTEAYNSIPDYPLFQRIVSVSSIPGQSGVKAVSVRVSWNFKYIHSVELKTILAR